MKRVWVVLIAVAVVLGTGCRQKPHVEQVPPLVAKADADARALVRQLGDDDWSRREEAQRLLGKMGDEAEAPLQEALASLDAEVHTRAARALHDIARERARRLELVPAYSLRLCGGEVWCVAFSPDGRLLASAGENGDVCLWDVERGALLSVAEAGDLMSSAIAFEPDGKRVLAITLYEPATRTADGLGLECRGRCERAFDVIDGKLRKMSSPIAGWEIIPLERYPRVALLAKVTYRAFHPPEGLPTTLCGLLGSGISGDGERLAVPTDEGEIHVLDREGRLLQVLKGHRGTVAAIAFSPDGSHLASAGCDGDVRVWRHGKSVRLRGHAATPMSVSFTPDNSTLVAVGGDAVALDLASGERRPLPLQGHLRPGPAGAEVYAFRDEAIDLWDAREGRRIDSIESPPSGVILRILHETERCTPARVPGIGGWSEYLDEYTVLSYDNHKLTVWDVQPPEPLRSIELPDPVGLTLSPDRQWLAVRTKTGVQVFRVKLPPSRPR